MYAYFIRRLLLIPFTLLGITFFVFLITRVSPGGPLEQALLEATLGAQAHGGQTKEDGGSLTAQQYLELEEYFGYDKGILESYLIWLGLIPREVNKIKKEFSQKNKPVRIKIPNIDGDISILPNDEESFLCNPQTKQKISAWHLRIESSEEQGIRWKKRHAGKTLTTPLPPRAVVYQKKFSGVLQGNLGESSRYKDPVWKMMQQRFPVSIYFGIISLLLTYAICLPLGVLKALRHRTFIDSLSSVFIFIGYAIPGFALGSVLLVYFGAQLGWFPLMGFTSDGFETLPWWEKITDVIHHTAMPLFCYLIGSFAFLTMMMKNNLMDHLAADYVRTATAKGLSFRKAVWKHAFRNSLIPIASTLGQNITFFVSGSFLIEKIFDINGFGLLSFNALLERDYPIIMGVLLFSALLMLLGNILSDLIVALVDPRVRFE